MANDSDSFIDEVSDELRRDRLFAAFRRWGWVGALLIVGIVGGAAWREWSAAQDRARAQSFGDAVLAADAAADPAAALAAIDAGASPDRAAVLGLLAAAEAGDDATRAARLQAVAETAGTDALLRDLARLKLALATADAALRDQLLADLARPGAPFAALALELQAAALVGAGRAEDALALVARIRDMDGLTDGQARRLAEMSITLGAEPPVVQ